AAGAEVFTTASIGIAVCAGLDGYLGEEGTVDGLLGRADVAMYAAKSGGRGRLQVYEPAMHRAALHRMELGGELRRAVERGEFFVEYQPVVALDNGTVSGVEALLRWQHPERGLIAPAALITAAASGSPWTTSGPGTRPWGISGGSPSTSSRSIACSSPAWARAAPIAP